MEEEMNWRDHPRQRIKKVALKDWIGARLEDVQIEAAATDGYGREV